MFFFDNGKGNAGFLDASFGERHDYDNMSSHRNQIYKEKSAEDFGGVGSEEQKADRRSHREYVEQESRRKASTSHDRMWRLRRQFRLGKTTQLYLTSSVVVGRRSSVVVGVVVFLEASHSIDDSHRIILTMKLAIG